MFITIDDVGQAMRAIDGATVGPLYEGADALLIYIERKHTRVRIYCRPGRTTASPPSLEIATAMTGQCREKGGMRGILEDVLNVADRLGLTTSLKAGSPTDEIPVNTLVDIYKKFGFEDTGESCGTGTVKMIRRPGAAIQPPTPRVTEEAAAPIAPPPATPSKGPFARLIAWVRRRMP
jgi:hypothetical protein